MLRSGEKRTSGIRWLRSAFDPKRTSAIGDNRIGSHLPGPALSAGREGIPMRRREFISSTASAAATLSFWPLSAGAQQVKPVVGYLGATSRDKDTRTLAAFHQGLKDLGFVEGQNVAIEYRWAEGRYDLLPALAADLVRQQVAVMFVPASTPAALAAKAASSPRFRLSSPSAPIRLPPGWSPALRNRAAMSPACRSWSISCRRSGSN